MNPLDLPLHIVLAGWLFRRLSRRIYPKRVNKILIDRIYILSERFCLSEIQSGFYPPFGVLARLCRYILQRHERKLEIASDFLKNLGCDTVFTVRKGD